MSLKERLYYDRTNDTIEGLEDMGEGAPASDKIANHASVFMVRSLSEKWKQPIAYYLTSGTMSPAIIIQKLTECVAYLQTIGFNPTVFVCDQGANNRSALKSLKVTSDNPWFTVNGCKIFSFFDTPHLLKNIRSNLKRHGFILSNGSKVLWDHVKDLYEYDSARQIRMVPKLTEKHISLPIFSTMSVPLAAQVMSHSVAAAMSFLADLGILPKSAEDTAKFIENFDQLFDKFNSSYITDTKPAKCAFNDNSITFLQKMLHWLRSIKLCNRESLPCLEGWISNINALLLLWMELKSDFKSLLTRHINQDFIEHFFGSIRSKGGNRDNPDPRHFRFDYRHAVVDKLVILGKNTNCEEEDCNILLQLRNHLNLFSPPANPQPVNASAESQPVHSQPVSQPVDS